MTRNVSFSWGYVMVSCSASNSDTLGKLLNVHFPSGRLWKSNYVPRNVMPFFMLQWSTFSRHSHTLLPSSFFSPLHRGLSALRLSWLSNPFLFTHGFRHYIRWQKSQSSTWQKKMRCPASTDCDLRIYVIVLSVDLYWSPQICVSLEEV